MKMIAVEMENRHPADRLAEVRAEIRRLQVEEERLRQWLIAEGEEHVEGDEHYVQIKQVPHTALDRDALEDRFGADAVAQCCKVDMRTMVYVHAITVRRMRARRGESLEGLTDKATR
jgi:hypothetical protein